MAPVNMTGAVVAAAALLMLTSYSFFFRLSEKKKRKEKLTMRNGLVDAIGNTPLIRINSLSEATGYSWEMRVFESRR
jgi:cysteine synthase A